MPGTTTMTDQRTSTRPAGGDADVPVRRVAGALVTGSIGTLAMYAVLAGFALAEGRGLGYPLRAVQGMMSGRRVIPDHPHGGVGDTTAVFDYFLAPTYFLAPGLAVALAALWWSTRRRRADLSPRAVAAPAVLVTAVFFVVFVLLLGYREVDPAIQRVSSGYGVRALGLTAWVLGHVAYATVLTLGLGRVTATLSKRRLRGEPGRLFEGWGAR